MDTIWNAERRLWTGDADAFRGLLARDCVMILPPPIGMMGRGAVVESVEASPRWRRVDMTREQEATGGDCVVIAYDADAERAEGGPYRARCSSCWVRVGGEWRMISHHQRPLEIA